MLCISCFSHCCDQRPDEKHFEGDEFALAYGFMEAPSTMVGKACQQAAPAGS